MQHDISADGGLLFRAADFPIERLDLVRQDHAIHAVDLGEHFEWVPLDLGGHWATDHQACLAVVVGWTND